MYILDNYMIYAFLLLIYIFPVQAETDVYVKGYFKKNGTYVAPHFRSDPNRTKLDNWSTKGTINPYTGKRGTKKVYESKAPSAPLYLYPSIKGKSYKYNLK